MPSLETHRQIAELLEIDTHIFDGVYSLTTSDSGSEEQWEATLKFIKVKNTTNPTDEQEVKELLKNSWWSAKCRKNIPCFFFKAQTAYDNFGLKGLNAYFLHHTVDYADWWQNPPEPYFLLKVRLLPEMTTNEERKLLGYVKQKLSKYQEFSLCPVSQNIYFVCHRLLDDKVFDITGSFKESNIKYRFNERTENSMKNMFSRVKDNFTEILKLIYQDAQST